MQTIIERITNNLLKDSFNTILTTSEKASITLTKNVQVIACKAYLQLYSLPISISIFWKILSQSKNKDLIVVHYPFPIADFVIGLWPFSLPPIITYWHSEIVFQKKLKKTSKSVYKAIIKKISNDCCFITIYR